MSDKRGHTDPAGTFVARDWMGPGAQVDPALLRAPRRARPRAPQPVLTSETDRAAQIIERGTQLLRDQFAAVRIGREPDMAALADLAHQVSQSVKRNKFAIVGLTRLRARHEYTFVHSVAVGALMMGVARELGLGQGETETLGLAGLLHDIGKSHIPVEVLDKPGPLDDAEWSTVKSHPEHGHEILSRIRGIDPIVLDVCLHHHERIDGTGYPLRLSGGALSLHARIAAVCDVYDALTSKRAYKDSRPPAEALGWMQRTHGHFDPALLRKLRVLIGTFPAGTLVRLQRGRLAVVLNEPATDPLNPRVRAFYCATMRRPLPPSVCDTANDPILSVERPDDWGLCDWDDRCAALMAA